MELKTAFLRGLQTAWLDNGKSSKDILFFLHGYPDTPETWEGQTAEFSQDYRVIAPFGRGVGRSAHPADKRRYGVYSILLDHLEILRLSDSQNSRSIHVIGHDWGGIHAWMLASFPNPRIKTLTVLNGVHPVQYLRRLWRPRQLAKSWYAGAFQLPYIPEKVLRAFRGTIVDSISAEGWKPPSGSPGPKDLDPVFIHPIHLYRQLVRDFPHFLRGRSKPIPAPTLVIAGEGDRYLEPPSTFEFKDIARNVTIRVIQGAHWLHREQPQRINRLLGDFWTKNK